MLKGRSNEKAKKTAWSPATRASSARWRQSTVHSRSLAASKLSSDASEVVGFVGVVTCRTVP